MSDIDANFTLGQRKALPADLRYLLERYPREQWQGHANLGGMAQFWLQRHDMFRELGATLTQSVAEYREGRLEAQPFASFFVPRLQFFLQQLGGHHQIEDLHYFPVFVQAEAGLKRGFDLLDSDHHVIHEALERNAHGANAFLGKLREGRDAARFAADDYAGDTEGLVAMLLRHLEDEEDLIVPVILDRGEASLGLM
jgi:hemerythrin-like domain-containing protein